jgi:hypothetical protein
MRFQYHMQPICTHKMSVQSSKPSHAYPIIRLPQEFSGLVGAAATIYETIHDGAQAFLVVVNSQQGHKPHTTSDLRNEPFAGTGIGSRDVWQNSECCSNYWFLMDQKSPS